METLQGAGSIGSAETPARQNGLTMNWGSGRYRHALERL